MTLFLLLALFACSCAQNTSATTDTTTDTTALPTTTTVDPNATTTTTTTDTTTTAAVPATTGPATTAAAGPTTTAAVLPPGCVLRPEVPGVTYQRLTITVQRDFLTTDCATFVLEVAQDMRLADTNQLWLTNCVSGSFVGSVSVSDPNSIGIVQTYLANVADGRVSQPGLSCVSFNAANVCVPPIPTWIVIGLVGLGICVLCVLIIILLKCCCGKKKRHQPRDAAYTRHNDVYMTDYRDPLTPVPGAKHSSPSVTVVRTDYARVAGDPTRHQMLYTVQDVGPNILQAKAGDVVIIAVDDWERRGEWVWGSLPTGQSGWLPVSYVK